MDIGYFTGDSFVSQNGYSRGKIKLKNCHFHNNRRQGMSVLFSDTIEIDNVVIDKIGDFDGISGTAPRSGIDIEAANGAKTVNNFIADKLIIRECTSRGIIISKPTTIINEFVIDNSDIQSIVGLLDLKAILRNTTIGNNMSDEISIQSIDLPNGELYNCRLENIQGNNLKIGYAENCIFKGKSTYQEGEIRDLSVRKSRYCTFKNIRLRQNSNSYSFGEHFQNNFDNIGYIQFALRDDCKFIDCCFSNIDANVPSLVSSNIAQIFYNCIFDSKILSNHILNNCAIINNIKHDNQ